MWRVNLFPVQTMAVFISALLSRVVESRESWTGTDDRYQEDTEGNQERAGG